MGVCAIELMAYLAKAGNTKRGRRSEGRYEGMKKTIWQIVQATNKDALEIRIYDSIMPDSFNPWTGEVITGETSAKYFQDELDKYPDVKFINLYVNSCGGDVKEAMGIHSALKRHSAHVTGRVDGFAASAASFVLTACDKVVMPASTMQMLHEMWSISIGNAKEHRKAACELDALMRGNRQAYLAKAGGKLNEAQLKEIMEAETWLTADECLEVGLCDEVIDSAVCLETAAARLQLPAKAYTNRQKSAQLMARVRQLRGPAGKPRRMLEAMLKASLFWL